VNRIVLSNREWPFRDTTTFDNIAVVELEQDRENVVVQVERLSNAFRRYPEEKEVAVGDLQRLESIVDMQDFPTYVESHGVDRNSLTLI
jgi:hypothetical protein